MLGTSSTAAWVALALAGLLEVGWAIGLKYTEGFSRLWPSVVTIALMAASFSLLSEAMRSHTQCGPALARLERRHSASCCSAIAPHPLGSLASH
jgi:hypothetical protein